MKKTGFMKVEMANNQSKGIPSLKLDVRMGE